MKDWGDYGAEFSILGGNGGAIPHPIIFFENTPIKTNAFPWGAPY